MSQAPSETPGVESREDLVGSRHRRLLKGITSGVLVRGVSALVSLFSLPLTLHYLGAEQYGVWVTVATTVAWIAILDLGVADTLTNEIARAFTFEDKAHAQEQFGNALVLSCSIALAAGCVGFVCWLFIPWADLLGVHGAVARNEVAGTLLAGMIVVLVGLPSNLFGKVLAGYQEVSTNNIFIGAGIVLSLIGLFAGIHFHLPMPTLLLVSVGVPTWMSVLGIFWLLAIRKPWLRLRRSGLHIKAMTKLLGTGSAFLMIHVAGLLAFGTDNVVVSHFLGAREVTPYAVTWRLAGYAGVLQNLLFPSLWPAYSEAFHRKEGAWLRRSLGWSMKLSLALGVGMCLTLVFLGKVLIRRWAGVDAVPPQALLLTIGLWNIIAGVMSAQSNFLGAIGRNKVQGILSLVAAVANLALSIWLVQRLGSKGVVLGTMISYLAILVIPQSVVVLRALREVEASPEASAAVHPA